MKKGVSFLTEKVITLIVIIAVLIVIFTVFLGFDTLMGMIKELFNF